MVKQERSLVRECPMCNSSRIAVEFVKAFKEHRWSLCRCRVCGLHFTDPRPTPAFLEQCYAGDYHAQLRAEGATERAFGTKFQRYKDWLIPHLPVGGRVLDIGCSTGLLVKMLSDQGFRAEGIELNSGSAEWGRKHYEITIHNEPIEECSFQPGSFDAIILADVLEHTLHPRDYLANAGNFLAPNGVILVTFPDIHSLESCYFFLMAKLTRRPWLWGNCQIPLHIWEFTRITAINCFEGAGFNVIAFRRSHDARATGLPKLINLPSMLLDLPILAFRLGTQMEFLIRRRVGKANARN